MRRKGGTCEPGPRRAGSAMVRVLLVAAVLGASADNVGAQARKPAGLPARETVIDVLQIAGVTYGGGVIGLVGAWAISRNKCDDEIDGEGGVISLFDPLCVFDSHGPFREGWYIGTSVGFSAASYTRARQHGCSARGAIPRLLTGAAAGALPAVVMLNTNDNPGAWRRRLSASVPMFQAGATALVLRTCHRRSSTSPT